MVHVSELATGGAKVADCLKFTTATPPAGLADPHTSRPNQNPPASGRSGSARHPARRWAREAGFLDSNDPRTQGHREPNQRVAETKQLQAIPNITLRLGAPVAIKAETRRAVYPQRRNDRKLTVISAISVELN